MPQLAYSINIPAFAFPGQLLDISRVKDALTYMAVAAALPYGILVVADETNTVGIDNLAAKVPAASTDITVAGSAVGIVIADQARAQDPSVAVAQYPINSAVPVLRTGRIVVSAETAVTDGQPVFARYAANGGLTQLGAIRADADTAHAAQVPNAVFRGTTTAAGFCVVELNLV